jgi:hypothetical protein
MRTRSFLFLLGFSCPTAAAGVLGGCGNVVVISPPGGTGGHGAGHSHDGGGPDSDIPPDALPDYVDPGCPDAGPAEMMFTCDPYNQHNGDCPGNEGCYIFSNPPQTLCGKEVYGSECATQGPGMQGASCNGGPHQCAAGFCCVVTGSGNQCVLLCELQGGTGCPDGLVCEPIDVEGFGGCL